MGSSWDMMRFATPVSFRSPGLQTQLCRVPGGDHRPVTSPLSETGVRSSLLPARLLSTKAITCVWKWPGCTWFESATAL